MDQSLIAANFQGESSSVGKSCYNLTRTIFEVNFRISFKIIYN